MKRDADPVDGLLLLNKPFGITSNKALQIVRKLLNARKAGHTGSLDPAATGMLPLCFGEATKVCAYLLNADKSYCVTIKLGLGTNTGDGDGQVSVTMPVPEMSTEQWNEIMQGFVGESMQIPPMYSALKIDGKRLYEIARKGETVDRKPRLIQIYRIELLEQVGARLVFRVRCSKGTYIRVLAEDIAKKAGTIAYTERLHRETVGDFKINHMLDMTVIEALAAKGIDSLRSKLLPADIALPNMLKVSIKADNALRFCGGQAVRIQTDGREGLAKVYELGQQFLGVGELSKEGILSPRRIFLSQEKNSVII